MVPMRSPIILFDGVCNLCNGWVRFVVKRDPSGIFRFAALQTPSGEAIIKEHSRKDHSEETTEMASIILIEGDAVYTESDAVLGILAHLGPPWSWSSVLRVVPKRVRDGCYRFIAQHRYQWFGRTDVCQVPSPNTRSRFID